MSEDDYGYADIIDNCPAVYNPSQMDWDHDGIGNACDSDCPDLDGGAIVWFADFSFLARDGRQTGSSFAGDLNKDNKVDLFDLAEIAHWWLARCGE